MSAILRLLRHPFGLWLPLLMHHALTRLRYYHTLYHTKYRTTYHQNSKNKLIAGFSVPSADLIIASNPWLAEVSQLYLSHRFNWLGLRWCDVGHDVVSPGLAGIRYVTPKQMVDSSGKWLASLVSTHNLPEAQALWQKITPDYVPIDWQRDHRSGYRWDMSKPAVCLKLYPQLGVDIKQPWELARLQHLPLLALAFICAQKGQPEFDLPSRYITEFKNVIYDFLASNPPKFGVNWMCSMDVAIRIVNILIANDLLNSAGANLGEEFQSLIVRTTHEHAEHIRSHLESRPDFRANHYLANIAGLLFSGFYLGHEGVGRDLWVFASREMKLEVIRQFHPDGMNFEASTAYHRLSGEIATWSLALICKAEGKKALQHELLERLHGIGEFIRTCARVDGTAIPIGDLDNGRFLKISSNYQRKFINGVDGYLSECSHGVYWYENLENHQHLALAIDCFFEKASPDSVESFLLNNLVKDTYLRPAVRVPDFVQHPSLTKLQTTGNQTQQYVWNLPGDDMPALMAYSNFGLYVVRAKQWLLTIRCGNNGQEGNGGHAHNDQLSVTLEIDGKCLIEDAGMALYNAIPYIRQSYRSVSAHFAPQIAGQEPADLNLDPFRLPPDGEGYCLHFSPNGFFGVHNGYGSGVSRSVTWTGGQLLITDYAERGSLINLLEPPFQFDGLCWHAPVPIVVSYGQIPDDFFIVKHGLQ